MTHSTDDEEKAKQKKAVLAGIALTAVVFGWFLYYFISNIPG
ncbi:MAG: hypothetical protein ACE5F3_06985 [Mariprofundaceae bacterium]